MSTNRNSSPEINLVMETFAYHQWHDRATARGEVKGSVTRYDAHGSSDSNDDDYDDDEEHHDDENKNCENYSLSLFLSLACAVHSICRVSRASCPPVSWRGALERATSASSRAL